MNNTTKIRIMSYASQPDKDYNYDGDYVDFEGKRYWVSLRTETVEFVGNLGGQVSDRYSCKCNDYK